MTREELEQIEDDVMAKRERADGDPERDCVIPVSEFLRVMKEYKEMIEAKEATENRC